MTTSDCPYGFRIVGGCYENRRLVDVAAAFLGYASCDDRAEVHREAYLSAFQFGEDFRRQLEGTRSTAKYSGPCWSPWLWIDLDSDELDTAHRDAAKLTSFLVEHFALSPNDLLIFFSGAKGFHVGLPTALWSPEPSPTFHKVCRRFAENIAATAVVMIDTGVYDKVRAFRAPNSRHPKTGLHKRRLSHDDLTGLPLEKIVQLVKTPAPFNIPSPPVLNPQAVTDWQTAMTEAAKQGEVKSGRRAAAGQREFANVPALNRATLAFIREGTTAGNRHRLLFSAAANLGEFHCPPALAVALLEESALDSGLLPRDVRRQIECGLAAVPSPSVPSPKHQASPESTQAAPNGSIVKEPSEAATSDSGDSQGQSCQQVTRVTESVADLQSTLAKLWQQGTREAGRPVAKTDQSEAVPAVLPPLPPPMIPLPPGAVGSGILDKPCKCGWTEYVELPISEGRTRRDCRKCGRFVGWGKWYDQGGPTP